ncbi:hypothetical protein [Flavobacterium aurantiibacter]|uniref:Uncharacterized protein n=1 Tax=Flavobacterium aurantiibacter TaxID=2023067 RepID=A0A255ZKW8_9FLAO|nr:hypothetical protein [Flavobacterium aurantiibacter]OYQ41554.1 hypothetical protein CHX27_12850 [Flavobacterium aurantiibacter]
MKRLILISALIAFSNIGCSDNTEAVSEIEPEVVAPENKFELYVNGALTDLTARNAFLIEDKIIFQTRSFDFEPTIKISKEGKIGQIHIDYFEFGVWRKFYNFRNFSSNFYSLEITSYDTILNRIEGNFSGFLYADPDNLNSQSKFVNGSFSLPVIESVPIILGLNNTAKINGVDWKTIHHYMRKDNPSDYHNLTLHTLSDDQFKILLKFNRQNSTPGIYSFNNNSITNSVKIAKYNTETHEYLVYDCTGTLEVTERVFNLIRGTYSFVGQNPNDASDTIEVTNGNFFLNFPQFD